MKRYEVPGKIRIISGSLRGRKITVPGVSGVRPTTDRVRETLFNWLMPYTQDANCLDLFAGSGALGFECLSRGGAHAVFIDQHPKVISQLHLTAETFELTASTTIEKRNLVFENFDQNVADKMQSSHGAFDIVFCDPPYDALIANAALNWILHNVLLSKNALIYLECSRSEILNIPTGVELFRQLETKTLMSYLFVMS